MPRRPNENILGANRYRTDFIDPLNSDSSSLDDFIVGSDEDGDENSDDNSNEESVDSDNSDTNSPEENDGNPRYVTPRKRIFRISSDEEDESEDRNDEDGISLNRSRKCPDAPKKRRRSADDDQSPVRRSKRLRSEESRKLETRRKLFDPYVDRRREKLTKLAKISFVEQPEEPDDEEEIIEISDTLDEPVANDDLLLPTPAAEEFQRIGQLHNVRDEELVDIRGKIIWYGDEDTRPVISGSFRIPIRQITIQDQTGTVNITLWREFAQHPNIQLGVFVRMYGLKKKTFREMVNLSTFRTTIIKGYNPPADFCENLKTLKTSRSSRRITNVDPWRSYVYEACAKCYYKKIDVDVSPFVCSKCGTNYDRADTAVGMAIRVIVQVEESGDEEMATVFTKSVRRLCPNIPEKWGDHGGVDLHQMIVDEMERIVPINVKCEEKASGVLEILGISQF